MGTSDKVGDLKFGWLTIWVSIFQDELTYPWLTTVLVFRFSAKQSLMLRVAMTRSIIFSGT